MVGFREQENKNWDNEKIKFWYIQQCHQELQVPLARGSISYLLAVSESILHELIWSLLKSISIFSIATSCGSEF